MQAASAELESDCASLREWLSIAGVHTADVRGMVASRCASLVHQHFDAPRLDDMSEMPSWLPRMAEDARWRALLYELCAAHPHCALLQSAVRGLSEGAHAAEVAAQPGLCALIGGASSLKAFVASLGAQLGARLQGLPGAQATLDGVACAGEVQHFCSQLLLHAAPLTEHAAAGLLEHARAAMAEAAAGAHGQPSRRLELLAAGVPRHSLLMSCLLSVLTAGAISTADAHTLKAQCEAGVEVDVLRQPAVLRLLLQALFDPARPPKPALRELLLHVLAHVAAAAAAAASGDSESRRPAALAALREAQSVCERNEVSEIAASVRVLQRCAAEPAVACGVLLWTEANLTNPRHSGARFNSSYMPSVLRLVVSIAERHAALTGSACALLHACLVHEPPEDSDTNDLATVALRRLLLDAMLLLAARGCVFPVLSILQGWLADADLSLVRHLVSQLLGLAAPPYSPPFASRLLAMLSHPRTLEAHRGGESRKPLLAFAEHAGRQLPELAASAQEAIGLLQQQP